MYNESVEFHVLSIEGSDKTRIRRTNGTPHLYIDLSLGVCAKRRVSGGMI